MLFLAIFFQFGVYSLKTLPIGEKELIVPVATVLERFSVGMVPYNAAYFIPGWYLTSIGLGRRGRWALYGLGALSLVISLSAIIYLSGHIRRPFVPFFSNSNIFKFFYTAAVFLLLYRLTANWKPSPRFGRLLVAWSSLVFGVYAVHLLFLLIFHRLEIFPMTPFDWSPILVMLVEWLVTLALSFGVSFGLSRIPYIRCIVKC